MNEIEYTIRKICQRRGVQLVKVESVAFNIVVAFGLANNSYLLPVVANVFYYLDMLTIFTSNGFAGVPKFVLEPNSGQGSAGDSYITINGASMSWAYRGLECDSMRYQVNTHSVGNANLMATCYKITYS